MKKIISILLVVLTVFSITATAAFAEDAAPAQKPIAVMFFDDNGTTQVGETVYVDYGEDINKYANKLTFTHPDIEIDGRPFRVVHIGWEIININMYKNQLIPLNELPTFGATDNIKEPIKIKAKYKEYEKTLSNEIQSGLEKLPGGDVILNASDFFTIIVDLIKKWVMQISLYLNAFMPKA